MRERGVIAEAENLRSRKKITRKEQQINSVPGWFAKRACAHIHEEHHHSILSAWRLARRKKL
jgi:hypothetical protein